MPFGLPPRSIPPDAVVQGRNLRRFEKLLWRQRVLEEAVSTAQHEARERRTEAALLRQHTAAVLGAVWRAIHEEPMERWPGIFGRLYVEHFKGAEPKSTAQRACRICQRTMHGASGAARLRRGYWHSRPCMHHVDWQPLRFAYTHR